MNTLFDTESIPQPKITTLAPWFGSNRMLAHAVGEELRGCKWVGVPFAGGMSELLHIKASTIVVGDLHRHVMNLAMVVADKERCKRLVVAASDMPFHPDTLAYAQQHCVRMEQCGWDLSRRDSEADETWALNYFIASWMGRSAKAGTDGEFTGGLPVRWNANGGDSNTRYRSAVESLEAWSHTLRRCNFVVCDVFDFLAKAGDVPGNGLYLDPPFPGPGDDYKHKFTVEQHRRLAQVLRSKFAFSSATVVCRFYDHPLVKELYPEGEPWTWRRLKGRDQANNPEKEEVLLVNRAAP